MDEKRGEFTFRDHLAASRTIFASERTLLAYFRTSATMLLLGITFLKFFSELWIQIMGWMLIPASIGLSLIGLYRHKKRKIVVLTEENHIAKGQDHMHKRKVIVRAREE